MRYNKMYCLFVLKVGSSLFHYSVFRGIQHPTRVSAELARALLTLFVAWDVAQNVRRARSETKHSDTP